MTPELKTACEVVFQEHKASGYSINWTKDAFRGRLSFGLAAMAKQTLERRNIICIANPAKKTITVLNPAVTPATTFEEAEVMVQNKVPVLVTGPVHDRRSYVTHHITSFVSPNTDYSDRLLKIGRKSVTTTDGMKWYLKPWFYYIVWPVCAAVAGGLIAWFLDSVYMKLFF